MTLRDLLKKREKIREGSGEKQDPPPSQESPPPQFTFMRTDTNTQEVITPPTFADDQQNAQRKTSHEKKRFSRFRSSSNASAKSTTSNTSEKRLSSRLHLGSHSRTSSAGSINVPSDLPAISDGIGESEDKEAQWENRATILAKENPVVKQSRSRENSAGGASLNGRPPLGRHISDAKGDENIQEAIKLHEAGDLEASTAMFGRLAESNAMAQIMYGLALRHGWGIPPDPPLAIHYLSLAASSAASIESAALSSGMKKGGAAKGELVLAIYELANSYRHGWGVEKDMVAARSYYECAANMGDTDAMNEVARCYEDGEGGKKDRYKAAQYYRLAESKGSKTLGNSWIWKDKYTPKDP
ncbi:MAG: hypothetical protein Q9215_002076 [Flavoplaca cf. flavocitrina]